MELLYEGWSSDRFEARAGRDLLLYSREVAFVAPVAQWNRNCNDIADGVTFTKVSGSCYPSQLPHYLFACDLACLSYADNISARRVPSSLCILSV